MAKKKYPRSTNMMYVQKMDHLPTKDLNELKEIIEQQVKPLRYAMIVHDQERDADGNALTPDVHVMLTFENSHYVSSIAKILNDQPQYIQVWDNKQENGYAYLVHATQRAREQGKHQYDPDAVIANFDFHSYLIKVQAKAARPPKSDDLSVKTLLDALYSGVLSREEVESRLTGSQLAHFKRQIDIVWAKVMQSHAAKWRKEIAAQGKQVTVIWLYGPAGAGKTRLAREIAIRKNQPYYMAGSSRDIFQDYAGEPTILLDELRPKVLSYQDLLRILDPFGTAVKAPSRYYDKPLAADLILVTSPYAPYGFWTEQFNTVVKHQGRAYKQTLADQGPDGFAQLDRRVSATIMVQPGTIDLVSFSDKDGRYNVVRSRINPYLFTPTTPKRSSEELFSALLDDPAPPVSSD